jgi:hypothetical protein
MYKRHVQYTKYVRTIPLTLGTPVPIEDCGTSAPGGFVNRIYLGNFTEGRVDILVNGKVIQSFPKEYIEIRKQLYTPRQRLLEDTQLTIIPCSPYLPMKNLEILVEGHATELIVEYRLIGISVPREPILIEQVQHETFQVSSGVSFATRFLHEVKELYMVVEGTQLQKVRFNTNEYTKFEHDAMYLHLVQSRDYHSGTPPSNVFTYSFSMDPESESYTGSIHMGRIQNQVFTFWGSSSERFTVRIYAVSYNILQADGTLEFINS